MKKLLLIICLLSSVISSRSWAQGEVQLNSEEKAYLYHVVMQSSTLRRNIGKYFEYTGEMIWLKDTMPNYDSLELKIIQEPELLKVYTHDLSRVSPGVLAEAANKMAIWKLNKALYHRKDKNQEGLKYVNTLTSFYDTLRNELPSKALRDDKGEKFIHARVLSILTPTLSLKEKFSSLNSFSLFTDTEKKKILEGINQAVNKWVRAESETVFHLLGGYAVTYENILMAAGDGSITSGLLSEQERDKKGRWNRGLPRAIGLFPYQLKMTEEKGRTKVEPKRVATYKGRTVGKDKSTLIHLDVWGYNAKRQTTVVLDIKNKQYVLYGSRESRLLSPDSSFVEGKTYFSLIDRLENHYIADLHEKMHGKKGYKFQLKKLREKKASLLLGIKNTEYDLSELRNSGITTTPKGKKKRRVKQHHLMALYTELSKTESEIKDLVEEMEEAHVKMGKMREKLADMYEIYGTNHVPFVYNNGIYTFEDSTTFNIYTQDLVLPKSNSNSDYKIRLIGILATAFSKQADEVMIHINQIDTDADRFMSINLKLNDFFDSDKFKVNHDLLTSEDSIACRELMGAILSKDKIRFSLSGYGVGKMNESKVLEKDPDAIEINAYPSEAHKNYREYRDLRTSLFKLLVNDGILIEVSSFTDPVKSNINIQNKKVLKLQSLYADLTKNDVLSALRTKALVERFMDEFSQLSGTYLDRKQASKVIDLMNSAIKKSKISIGKTSLKWAELSL